MQLSNCILINKFISRYYYGKIEITEPGVITAVITRESAEELDLKEGDEVKAIIKSTEVMVAK